MGACWGAGRTTLGAGSGAGSSCDEAAPEISEKNEEHRRSGAAGHTTPRGTYGTHAHTHAKGGVWAG